MLEHIADFTAWPILTGILVGYVANRIMSGEVKGCCMNLIIGIIGSYVGTFISHLLNIELLGKGYLTRSSSARFATNGTQEGQARQLAHIRGHFAYTRSSRRKYRCIVGHASLAPQNDA